jgi:hypothetical protein
MLIYDKLPGTLTYESGSVNIGTLTETGGLLKVYITKDELIVNAGKVVELTIVTNINNTWDEDSNIVNTAKLFYQKGTTIPDPGEDDEPDNKDTAGVYRVTVRGSYASDTGAGFYPEGATVTINAGTRSGHDFGRWTTANALDFANYRSNTTTFTMIGEDVTVTANWTERERRPDDPPVIDIQDTDPPLSTYPFIPDHVAYVIGYPDGNVKPERNVTRAEVTTVFFRLLLDSVRKEYWTQNNSFSDVQKGFWYNNAVSVMSKMEVVNGYPDGTFKPNGTITRGELATIAARFARMRYGIEETNPNVSFSDIAGHWAEKDIKFAASIGWVNGYPDGTCRPNNNITRAEFMTLVNRMLERAPERPGDLLPDMIKWPDNADTNKWYYLAIQEASNSHEPVYKSELVPGMSFPYEYWLQLIKNRDWAQLEKEWVEFYSE